MKKIAEETELLTEESRRDRRGRVLLSEERWKELLTGYADATAKGAAMFQSSLAADNYTVQVRDASGGSGTVIAEIYDATPSQSFTVTTPRLVNVSVLKQIAAGSSLAIGFVVDGASASP